MIVRSQIDAVTELQRAFTLMRDNWKLALPTAIGRLAVAVIALAVATLTVGSAIGAGLAGGHTAAIGAGLLTMLVSGAISVFAIVLIVGFSQAVVVAAADGVLQGQAVDLRAAWELTLSRGGPLCTALLIGLAYFLVCGMLMFVAIGFLLIFVVGFGTMYVLPAVVIGKEPAAAAFATSWRMARDNWQPTAIAFGGILVALVAGQIVNVAVSHIPLVNFVAIFAVGGFTSAYMAIVQVRFYELLSGGSTPVPAISQIPA